MVSFSAAFSAAVSPTPFVDLRAALFVLFFAAISGRHFLADLRRLKDPDAVAERVTDAHVGPIRVLDGLLGEVGDAARYELLVQTPGVLRLEDETTHGALGDQFAELRRGGVVLHRRARLLEEDLDVVTGHSHG